MDMLKISNEWNREEKAVGPDERTAVRIVAHHFIANPN